MRTKRTALTRWDWISLGVVLLLLAVWILTGCRHAWMRHLGLGLTFLYLFVIRIIVNYNRLGRDAERKE